MYKLANSLFHDLLHKTTVQRGLDPRNFALFSFGGTAGMHVAAYAEDNDWLPPADPPVYRWEDVPRLAEVYRTGAFSSYFPLFEVNR